MNMSFAALKQFVGLGFFESLNTLLQLKWGVDLMGGSIPIKADSR
jgi:hypothetical protein